MKSRRSLTASEPSMDDVAPSFGQEEGFAGHEDDGAAPVFVEPEEPSDFWEEEPPAKPRWTWVTPTLAVAALLGWTGFFGWANQQEMLAGATPQQWTQWISSWAIPAIFILAVWMLIQRNNRREANRFTDAARLLSHESRALEERLTTVNRELSIARDFIAAQSRDLESLGRSAAERLNDSAEYLQSLVQDNAAQVETIGTVSQTAVANMENLRANLPVLGNAARDLSSQIGNAGQVAHSQVESLIAGFDRLNQFGEAGERHVTNINERVSSTLAAFDAQVTALGETTQARFGRLREISESFRTDMIETEDSALESLRVRAEELQTLLSQRAEEQRTSEEAALSNLQARLAELSDQGAGLIATLADGRDAAATEWQEAIEALETRVQEAIARIADVDQAAMDNARRRLAVLTEEAGRADQQIAQSLASFDAQMDRRRDISAARQAEELAELDERLAVFDTLLAERREGYEAALSAIAQRSEGLLSRLSTVEADLAALRQAGEDADAQLGGAAEQFAARLATAREALDTNSTRIAQLTNDGVRLLEIIRASAEHSEGTLSNAVSLAETRLTSFAAEAERLSGLIADAEAGGERLMAHIADVRGSGTASLNQLATMESRIASVLANAEELAKTTRDELQSAIATLSDASENALTQLRASQGEVVDEIANSIASESRVKIASAIRSDAVEVIAELEAAVAQSSQRGQQTTKALRDQLALLNDLAGNLEQRITYARERAEERVDSDFSRRVALITESLNSSAIDIAKAFDNEVSDTQWANYLKGDRGIFTRRAVRLLDRGESRAVAEVYEEDSEFRETVNRFIHDFEAMLREVLATRDGNALAVTLLSSDTGKLYVALAQAIERLRN
ncbi:ATPase [Erythrobacter sp. EC-HK427]|uniref:ATPase n=1 Tax=Erythrobacter sp. EC-HK427 TaxID=2038396 RepID=UPI00125A204C|nr:ATPase [Erythrobacter sp. EC-HK427]VVT16494.1 ATPase [Erythrobacter sp. EC-HK427]